MTFSVIFLDGRQPDFLGTVPLEKKEQYPHDEQCQRNGIPGPYAAGRKLVNGFRQVWNQNARAPAL